MDIILVVAMIVLTVSNATLCAAVLRLTKREDKAETTVPKPSFSFFKEKEKPETEEEKKYRILQENIEKFDGTAKGQVKI